MKEKWTIVIGSAIVGTIIGFILEPLKEYVQSPWIYAIILTVVLGAGFTLINKYCSFGKEFVLANTLYGLIISLLLSLSMLLLMGRQIDLIGKQADILMKQTKKIQYLESELSNIKNKLDSTGQK